MLMPLSDHRAPHHHRPTPPVTLTAGTASSARPSVLQQSQCLGNHKERHRQTKHIKTKERDDHREATNDTKN